LIYEIALLVLVAASLLKSETRPFGFVLSVVWLLDAYAARNGMFMAIPWIDAVGSYVVLYLAYRNPKWWAVGCSALVLAAMPVHLWFWTLWAQGIGVSDVYAYIQNALFALALAFLVAGTTDVRRIYAPFVVGSRGFRFHYSGMGGLRRRPDFQARKET
jgi:hypothetical protein